MRLGICLNLLGEIFRGIDHLQKALQLWGRHTVRSQVADIHSALASAYSLVGNFALAEHHLSSAITCENLLLNKRNHINNLIRMGLLKRRQGIFSEAEPFFMRALTVSREPLSFQRGEAYALVNLGELYLDQGHYNQALSFAENGLMLARQMKDTYLATCSLHVLAMSYLLIGDTPTALLLASEMQGPAHQKGSLSYEQSIYGITWGFEEACIYLLTIEKVLEQVGLKREQLQVKVRIAACYLEMKRFSELNTSLTEIASFLSVHTYYEQLVRLEIDRHPGLLQYIKSQSPTQKVQSILHLKDEAPSLSTSLATREDTQLALLPAVASQEQAKIKILALGEPAIYLTGKIIMNWRMTRTMELCFFLLDWNRPVRKEQIITALWPEVDDRTDHTFHTTLYYLRKVLGGECVVLQSGTYVLQLKNLYGDEIWYDVEEFKKYYSQARQALAEGNDQQARDLFLAMLELYRGNYLQAFFNDWCIARRDELLNAYLDAHCSLASLAWRHEAFDESIQHCQHVLAVDPSQEEAYYYIMRCYIRQGKKSQALRQYRRCKEILQQELGVAPGQAIQRLYQHISGASN
jgi:DNA-binding SARP family transcriptional activator